MSKYGPIIIVCTANICRSPMAEGLLKHALGAQPEPLRSLKVISAGVAARTGEAVSANSVTALKKAGIDISAHRSQPLSQKMMDEALAIFCMTESHRDAILSQADRPPAHVYLFREFIKDDPYPEIADPFGGPLRLYEASRDEMVEAIPSVVAFLKKITSGKA